MTDLTPREIVSELDRFIIGQGDAKRAETIERRALAIAGEICVYTNGDLTGEILSK